MIIFKPLQNECLQGYTGISLSVHMYVCLAVHLLRVSVCVQNTTFCQSTGWGIKSHFDWNKLKALILQMTNKNNWKAKLILGRIENIVGKGEISEFFSIFSFSQNVFKMLPFWGLSIDKIVW